MAKYKYNNNGASAEDRAFDAFADLMVQKIEQVKEHWQKPWFSKTTLQWPKNLSGREYNGMNAVVLLLQQEKNNWSTNRYATFERISSLNFDESKNPIVDKDGQNLPFVTVKKGEKSTPVMITSFTVVHKETKDKIKYDDYKNLSDEEKLNYAVYPKLHVYNVFNIDQTNIKEARPKLYEQIEKESEHIRQELENNSKEFSAVDTMINENLYVCPIKPTYQDRAYYSLTTDEIIVPEKSQFRTSESFYGTLFHEMSHASGAVGRLNRIDAKDNHFGSENYAKEELVAELTAALLSTKYGMEKNVNKDSVPYIKSWLEQLKQDPSFIKTVLMDVKRSSNYISSRVDAVDMRLKRDGLQADFSDIREQNKNNSILFVSNEQPAIQSLRANTHQQESEIKETEKREVQESEYLRFRR